ncbi:DNA repair protein RAD16 [Coemansia sp. RSA 1933]|nr:DNA repair protein RAD16 [Coemansia sp. RSA 1933]
MAPVRALLPFQRQILDELIEEDALCIVARGLGLNRIVAELARICATPQVLVFLVNTSDQDEDEIQQQLMQQRSGEGQDDAAQMHRVTAETNAPARARLYRQGGLVSVTSRILVVDLLNGLVPAELVTGVIVHNASRVGEESVEAFVLRLVRQQNTRAFVKAVSDAPEAFTLGFAPLGKTLRVLGVRHVHLWPRFHMAVQRDLADAVAVAELRQPQTRAMEELQQAVLDCLAAVIGELGSATRLLDAASINVESCLFRYFDAMVRRMLNPHWHRLSPRIRAMVTDLASLRRIAEFITAYDCVSLLRFLDTLLVANRPGAGISAPAAEWLASDSANILYSVARARVFRTGERVSNEGRQRLRAVGLPETIVPVLEVPPKLELLTSVLEEIGVAIRTGNSLGPVLVMAASVKECRMIRTHLSKSGAPVWVGPGDRTGDGKDGTEHPRMMVDLLRGFFRWKASMSGQRQTIAGSSQRPQQQQGNSNSSPQQTTTSRAQQGNNSRAPAAKRRRVRGGSAAAGSGVPRAPADALEEETNGIAVQTTEEHGEDEEDDSDDELFEASFDEHYGVLPSTDTIVVQPYGASTGILEALHPTHIVMYDPDPAFIRMVEVFQAASDRPLKHVYFMVYDNSLEEQRYLSAIRREREAFERLIGEKATVVVPIDDAGAALQTMALRSSRDGRGSAEIEKRVVVDVREFRAPLPSLLHAAGFEVVARTLAVGDYVLHDALVVERKSPTDLVGSLRSGRLFTQAAAMTAHYATAALLIEFEPNASFSLLSVGNIAAHVAPTAIHSQLAVLALAFPRLRFLWSCSPYETAAIFADLKRNAPEPDIDRAVAVGQNDPDIQRDSVYATQPVALLQALPGVTERNYQHLARAFRSIRDLCLASRADIAAVIGSEAAGKLHDFIHTNTKI